MGDVQKELGQKVRNLRRALGLTQEQLAERAGISLKHLGELERGRSNPTLSSLVGLASSLGVPLPEFFTLEEAGLTPERARETLHRAVDRASGRDLETLRRILAALKR